MSPQPNSPLHNIGPKGPIGSVFNVVVCGAMAVFAVVAGVLQQPGFFLLAIVAAGMEFQFVPTMLRAFRRRKDAQSTETSSETKAGHP
ncbi:hypothetical protein [Herbiconiux solani]|uniref:hypothetical protein n=1 Tax=Herbiconiux solani TaxID=661329 RepID=UPI000824EECB|nr:hypothetical protein [Herbiconiux solani]